MSRGEQFNSLLGYSGDRSSSEHVNPSNGFAKLSNGSRASKGENSTLFDVGRERGTRVGERSLGEWSTVVLFVNIIYSWREFSGGIPRRVTVPRRRRWREEQGRRSAEEEGRGRKRGEVLRRTCGRTDGPSPLPLPSPPPPPYRTASNAAGNRVAARSAYLGSGRIIFWLARAAGVHLLFSMAIR